MPPSIPRLGLGTWKNDDPEQCAESVRTALDVGYRHIDTAQSYGNESAVGRGIRESSVDREDVFLATKVSTQHLAYDDVLRTVGESLERLDVSSVDLLYVHWPIHTYDPEETLTAFDELHDDGLVDHVGLSNFELTQLAEAYDRLDAPILAHQVEMHLLCQQADLLADAWAEDYWLVAYSPLARGDLFGYTIVREVAEEVDATPAQVCLAWLLSKDNVIAIPKATGEEHIRDNVGALDVELTPAQVDRLDDIDDHKRVVDPDVAPWNRPSV